MVYKRFDKKSSGGASTSESMLSHELAKGNTNWLLDNLKNKKSFKNMF